MTENLVRCGWVGTDEIYIDYHDKEWGRPCHDEIRLFEKLNLEGMQAGLSWITILKKRENFRLAFDNFKPEKIALYGDEKIESLMLDAGIIRNRLKINSVINNAKVYLNMRESGVTLDDFFWKYVDGKTVVNHFKTLEEVPANTPTSDAIAKELKRLGYKFVGTTIVYALMQAMGMVNDHIVDCFCHEQIGEHI